MSISLEDLAFGLYWEHRERTGHDDTETVPSMVRCMSCIYIRRVMRQAEEAHNAAGVTPDAVKCARCGEDTAVPERHEIFCKMKSENDAGVTPDERASLGVEG